MKKRYQAPQIKVQELRAQHLMLTGSYDTKLQNENYEEVDISDGNDGFGW